MVHFLQFVKLLVYFSVVLVIFDQLGDQCPVRQCKKFPALKLCVRENKSLKYKTLQNENHLHHQQRFLSTMITLQHGNVHRFPNCQKMACIFGEVPLYHSAEWCNWKNSANMTEYSNRDLISNDCVHMFYACHVSGADGNWSLKGNSHGEMNFT